MSESLQQELADILRLAPLETSVLGPFVNLSLAIGRPHDAVLALERFVLLDEDAERAERVAGRLAALRRSLTRGPRAARRVPSGTRLKVLLASVSGAASSTTFYERAWRQQHDVVTFGPMRDPGYWKQYAEAFRAHAFYQEGAAEAWLDVTVRDTRPCDITVDAGIVDMRDVLARLPEGFTPDVLVWIDQDRFNLPLNLHLVACPTLALVGDSHLGLDWRRRYAAQFDHVSVMYNRHHGDRFQAGTGAVGWLPAACDPEIHAPEVPSRKCHDVAFVGSTHPTLHAARVARIRALQARGIPIYVDCRPPQATARIFAESRIVLNQSIGDDLNMRVFEGLASGSLLVTNRLPAHSGMGELFVEGTHYVGYGDDEELEAKLRYYLDPAHAAERDAIAARGRTEVLARHTYGDRVRTIVGSLTAAAGAATGCSRPSADRPH
ncbi:MAG: glycosyltransferase [Vicinamibacterales bacterium]